MFLSVAMLLSACGMIITVAILNSVSRIDDNFKDLGYGSDRTHNDDDPFSWMEEDPDDGR